MTLEILAAAAKALPFDAIVDQLEIAIKKYKGDRDPKKLREIHMHATIFAIKRSTEGESIEDVLKRIRNQAAASKFFDVKPN